MCVVLDSNKIGDFLKKKPDMLPIHNWLKTQNGKLVYSDHPKIKSEIKAHHNILLFLRERRKVGQAKWIASKLVEQKKKEIKQRATKQRYKLKSNDIHILALAKASGSRLLCSEDQKLHQDFKKMINDGSIYQNKNHKKLLKTDICP